MSLLYLIRHGETAANAVGEGLGRRDVPLSPFGREQAHCLAERFASVPIDAVLSSPLRRALEVSRPIAERHGLAVDIRPELTEMDVGATDGLTSAEIRERFPEFIAAWTGENPAPVRMPGGESLQDLAARVLPLAEELLHGPDRVIVLVSHNFTLRVLLCLLLALPLESFRTFRLDLASVTTVSIQHGRTVIQALNDVCHLEDALNLGGPARSVAT
ncbi:histidine phosphatase family protein [Tepidiforma sp.]|uniref:histidine phosphatase family protein n=1 Tax=Tepidiforma sp. TaxID=2682230 RepID=UPI002ADD73C3|nr:histidine phosphatase family protein [Tepidiforma sp.]